MLLSDVTPAQIKSWWRRNFFLDAEKITVEVVQSMVSDGIAAQIDSFPFYTQCYDEYMVWNDEQPVRGQAVYKTTPEQMDSMLDGMYWNKYGIE